MSKFKTKYKLSPSAIDTLQYVRPNAEPTTNKDQGTKMKDPNYMISANKAISSNKESTCSCRTVIRQRRKHKQRY